MDKEVPKTKRMKQAQMHSAETKIEASIRGWLENNQFQEGNNCTSGRTVANLEKNEMDQGQQQFRLIKPEKLITGPQLCSHKETFDSRVFQC